MASGVAESQQGESRGQPSQPPQRKGDRQSPSRHGWACPGHPRLATPHAGRGCPGQARAWRLLRMFECDRPPAL